MIKGGVGFIPLENKMRTTTLLEALAGHLETIPGSGFVLEDEVINMRGCGWNDANVTDEVDRKEIRCTYADLKPLTLSISDRDLFRKVGHWASKVIKKIVRDNATS